MGYLDSQLNLEATNSANDLLKTPRILLVDDDIVFCQMMEWAARSEEIPLIYCQSLDELADVRDDSFDIAIIDYDLGFVTGVELSDYLEHHFGQKRTMLISQNNRAMPVSDPWPDSIINFMMKSEGIDSILNAALHLNR